MMWHPGRVLVNARPRAWLVVGLAVALVALALAGLAGAQPEPRLVTTTRSGRVGASVSLHGTGFRPHVKGIVVFGKRRVASFKATRRGGFSVEFLIPAHRIGRVQLIAEQVVRSRHGAAHRLRWATARFRVLAPVPPPGAGRPSGGTGRAGGGGGASGGMWVPPRSLTWYWQLQGTVNNTEPVAAYDIDGFDNTTSEVAALHAKGIHVICYIDVGTAEPFRPDFSEFPASVKGTSLEPPFGEEKWLDVRQLSILEPIMIARFQMCKSKGFDAVEPDNMDGYENKSGFPLTAANQLTYDEWVAGEVHSLGMAVFQKNDGEQTASLKSHFDGALTEECNVYEECSSFTPYLAEGKPVLNAEYNLA